VAGFLARGSSLRATFPETGRSPVAFMAVRSPLTVAGAAAELHARIGRTHRIPLVSPCGHHQGQRCIRFAQRQLRLCVDLGRTHTARVMMQRVCRRARDALKSCGRGLSRRVRHHRAVPILPTLFALYWHFIPRYRLPCRLRYFERFQSSRPLRRRIWRGVARSTFTPGLIRSGGAIGSRRLRQ
jgi:hypothetical protein